MYDYLPSDFVSSERQWGNYDLGQSDAMNEYYEQGYYDNEDADDDFVYEYEEEMPMEMESEPEAQEDQIEFAEMDDRELLLDADEVRELNEEKSVKEEEE